MCDYTVYCYSKALFECSIDNLESLLKSVNFVLSALNESSDILNFLLNSTVSTTDKLSIVIYFKDYIDEILYKFICIIISNKRAHILLKTLIIFFNIVKSYRKEIDVKITTFTLLSQEDVDFIVKYLSDRYAVVNIVSTRIDDSIMGGFIIEFESFIMDMSLLKRLNNLLNVSKTLIY